MLKPTALALALGLAATPALADQHATGGAEGVEFLATQDATTWTATMLTGSEVVSPGGFAVGRVNDVLVRADGVVSAVVIHIGGVLGVGGKDIAVPFAALQPKPGKDGAPAFVLNVTKDQIKAAPAFKRMRPTMSDKAVKMMKSARQKMEGAAETMGESAKEMMESGKKMIEPKKN